MKATSDSELWVINRTDFKSILLRASDAKIEEYTHLLDAVSILDPLMVDEKKAVAEALVEMHFQKEEFILSQGEMGNTFFILYDGEVQFIVDGEEKQKLFAKAKEGKAHFFGERALLKGEARAASVKVISSRAKVLALDRDSFDMLLGPLQDIMDAAEKKATGGGRKSLFAGAGVAEKKGMEKRGSITKSEQRYRKEDLKKLGSWDAAVSARSPSRSTSPAEAPSR